ncbi:MAG: ArdC family protein [Fluviibacter phosphoraccumulans]
MDDSRSGEISPSVASEQQPSRNDKSGKPDYRTELTNKIIEHLENGTAPWQKPWDGRAPQLPINAATGKPYQGCNSLWLSMQEYNDPRWATYKQATELGWQVKKGQKSSMIEYWKTHDEQNLTDDKGKPVLGEDGKPKKVRVKLDWPRVYRALVFNARQMDNVPPLETNEPKYDWDPVERAEKIIDASGAFIYHDELDQAYYTVNADEIHLPDRTQFKNDSLYYGTVLHELGHWTGHPLRLNRDMTGAFGSEAYAKEELRAELASYFMSAQIGIAHDPERHASYVGGWIKALKSDPNEIFRASKDAERMTQYVLDVDLERDHMTYDDPTFKPKTNPQTVLEEGVFAMEKTNKPVSKPDANLPPSAANRSTPRAGNPIYDIASVPEGIKLLAKEQFGQRIELYTPRENGGPYKGEIVNTPTHLLQEVGPRAVVIHDKAHVQLASKTLSLRDQEHRLNNTDVQIHYAGKEGKAYPLDRQKDMLDRALGSLKKSANELGYSKEFMAQLDVAQGKTIERLKALRQGPATPKIAAPETNEPAKPARSR